MSARQSPQQPVARFALFVVVFNAPKLVLYVSAIPARAWEKPTIECFFLFAIYITVCFSGE